MVTHDPIAASYASRVVFLADGKVTDELANPNPDAILDRMRRLDAEQQLMWKVTRKGLVAHKLRFVLTAIAVILGVAFISGTFVFTATIQQTRSTTCSRTSTRAPTPSGARAKRCSRATTAPATRSVRRSPSQSRGS